MQRAAFATRDKRVVNATGAHRQGARDRSAFERDGSIFHANHAAVALLTTEAAMPAASARHPVRPHPPQRASARIASPPRPAPHRCLGAGYRHGVEQRGALGHGEHAAVFLRTSASRRRSAPATARPSPNRAKHAQHTPYTSHGSALRGGGASRSNMQRAPMQRATRTDATCKIQHPVRMR